MNILYLKGDATNPMGDGNKIIPHITNTIGAWGAGFVLAISKRWKEPEDNYKKLINRNLGDVQFIKVESNIIIANMTAQEGIRSLNTNIPPIRYNALRECLKKVNIEAINNNATIHMPRIGAGLAGGNWNIIANIIEETITVNTYVYDFNP